MSKEIDWGGAINPVGTIINYLGTIAPDGYLFCDGTEYNIVDYPALANHFETNFGTKNFFGGDGETTFKVPDLQGEFLRCTGTNTHTNRFVDIDGSGAAVGVHQEGTVSMALGVSDNNSGYFTKTTSANVTSGMNPDSSKTLSNKLRTLSTSGESSSAGKFYSIRPTNTSVWYCIKY